jgi:hypothetical protein
MCQAHVLRFCCGHGLLMSLEPCKLGPCCIIKTTGKGMGTSQLPHRCYRCERRRSSANGPRPSRLSSCTSSISSAASKSSSGSLEPPISPLTRAATAPLPGVAFQPAGTVSYCQNMARPRSQSDKSFSFSCSSREHAAIYHYTALPNFLPHQNHPCPPCQLENLKTLGDQEAISAAKAEYPHLKGEMLVRNGRIREDWESNLTLDKYIDEKRTDERQMWHHVVRKWTQDLKKMRVLLDEEDGLALLL